MINEYLKISNIISPVAAKRIQIAKNQNKRFVYYTNAETADSILKKSVIWMRNTACMNDFSEINYGISLVDSGLNRSDLGNKFREILKYIFNDDKIVDEYIFKSCRDWQHVWAQTTYITCISEHEDTEDGLGRLSMWRAYGRDSGIALVLKGDVFFSDNTNFSISTSPVEYLDQNDFNDLFKETIESIEKEKDYLKEWAVADNSQYEALFSMIITALKYACLSIKHPGFSEEKEWRIIYSAEGPKWGKYELEKDVCCINGILQSIYKIPLKKDYGFSVPDLLDKVIIGPTQYASVMKEAFEDLLKKNNVPNLKEKIKVSNIPLRIR